MKVLSDAQVLLDEKGVGSVQEGLEGEGGRISSR
jgi:hypothetical protein